MTEAFATPQAVALPHASPAPTGATPSSLFVANAGSEGVRLRTAPGSGEALKVLQDGASVTPLGDERQEGGRTWRHVRDVSGTEGWIASDFLAVESGSAPPSGTGTTGTTLTPTAAAQAGQRPSATGQAQPRGGACPSTHPIKGNVSPSGERIYHVPSGAFYARTFPEACFASEADARAAGFRASLR